MTVEHGLNSVRNANGRGGPYHGLIVEGARREAIFARARERCLAVMATDARNDFARHAGEPASHQLHCAALLIRGWTETGVFGRDLEGRRAVLFHRNGTQNPLDVPAALDTNRGVASPFGCS